MVCILNQLFYSADHMVMRCVRGSGLARRHQEQGVLPPIAVLHAQDFGERHFPQACVLGLCLLLVRSSAMRTSGARLVELMPDPFVESTGVRVDASWPALQSVCLQYGGEVSRQGDCREGSGVIRVA